MLKIYNCRVNKILLLFSLMNNKLLICKNNNGFNDYYKPFGADCSCNWCGKCLVSKKTFCCTLLELSVFYFGFIYVG